MASFFVRKSGPTSWSVIEQSYDKGKSIQKTIPKETYRNLGLDPNWPLDKAKEAIKILNSQNHIERKKQREIIAATTRFIDLNESTEAFFPTNLTEEFTEKLIRKSFGSERHKKKLLSHWKYIRKMFIELKIKPQDYADNAELIYQYFIDHENSNDYVNKLVRIINEWGYFICKKLNIMYEPIKTPKGIKRTKISKSYRISDKYKGPSEPLTPEILESVRLKLPEKYYNWLFISVWFGLRPEEIDNLKKSNFTRIDEIEGTKVLCVFQTKLETLEDEDRWKMIPCVYDEQIKALDLLKAPIKRPLGKKMREIFNGITLYGGRKGFEFLMREKGHSIEEISTWLGHQSIETTWRKYRNRRKALIPLKKTS